MNNIKILQIGGIVLTALGAVASGAGQYLEQQMMKQKITDEAVKKVVEIMASTAKETL